MKLVETQFLILKDLVGLISSHQPAFIGTGIDYTPDFFDSVPPDVDQYKCRGATLPVGELRNTAATKALLQTMAEEINKHLTIARKEDRWIQLSVRRTQEMNRPQSQFRRFKLKNGMPWCVEMWRAADDRLFVTSTVTFRVMGAVLISSKN